MKKNRLAAIASCIVLSGTFCTQAQNKTPQEIRIPDTYKLTNKSIYRNGWIDFNNETLDCNFTVNMKNFPDFPLRLYGSLENSKTSIGAGTLLLNTIGGITQGFIDVLGSVVEGTWRLFR